MKRGYAVSNKIVIICADYGNIPSALYLAKTHYRDSQISLVVPGHHDLYKFFQVINERVFNNAINLIYFEVYRGRRVDVKGINKLFYVIPDIIGERRHLKESFTK